MGKEGPVIAIILLVILIPVLSKAIAQIWIAFANAMGTIPATIISFAIIFSILQKFRVWG